MSSRYSLPLPGTARRRACVSLAVAGVLAALLPAGTLAATASTGGWTVSRASIPYADLVAVDPATDTVYVDGPGATGISVIDGTTGAVTAPIPLPGTSVDGLAVNPVTDTVYATERTSADTGASSVVVIDGATNTVTTTITEPAFSQPEGIAVDSATDMVYVANIGSPDRNTGNLTVINGATSAITATVAAPAASVAVDEATNVIYAVPITAPVSVIDGATNTVTASISLGTGRATGVAVNPDTQNGVAVINGATNTLTTTVAVTPGPDDVAVNAASDTVFASTGGTGIAGMGETSVIDGNSNTVTATLPRGSYAVAADPDTGTAYAPGFNIDEGNDLWIITPSPASQLSPIILGNEGTTFTVGTPASTAMLASATPAPTYTETGALPAGISLSPAGTFAGTPAAGTAGSYPITITAANGIPPDDSRQLTFTVVQNPAITSAARTTFRVGTRGSFDVHATAVPAVSTFSEYGKLPAGVTFTSQGILTGTPAAGTGRKYWFTILATNGIADAAQTFALTVEQAPAITSPDKATFTARTRNRFTVRTTGYPAPRIRITGHLPKGLRLEVTRDGTTILTGAPAASTRGHTYLFTIIASNGTGPAARQKFTLCIRRAAG
jgi:YVTN family beta-propeller protein